MEAVGYGKPDPDGESERILEYALHMTCSSVTCFKKRELLLLINFTLLLQI